jgi:hypothetical protein
MKYSPINTAPTKLPWVSIWTFSEEVTSARSTSEDTLHHPLFFLNATKLNLNKPFLNGVLLSRNLGSLTPLIHKALLKSKMIFYLYARIKKLKKRK